MSKLDKIRARHENSQHRPDVSIAVLADAHANCNEDRAELLRMLDGALAALQDAKIGFENIIAGEEDHNSYAAQQARGDARTIERRLTKITGEDDDR